jgi:2-dehydro-3-deoxygalactonokinase
MRIVTIDTGTTNTSAWVVADGEILSQARGRGGASDVAGAKDRRWLARRIRSIVEKALAKAGMSWPDVEAMVGFGMLTSELGLEEIPHLTAPVGARQLAQGLRLRSLADDIPTPLHLVPGVLFPGMANSVGADFMRGEETEVIGLLSTQRVDPPLLYVSPGSHPKFVAVTEDGRIEWSFSTISGELVWALSQDTILGPILDPSQPLEDIEAAERGAQVARQAGLSRALYSARLSNRLGGFDVSWCTDYVRGAIAATDVDGLRSMPQRPATVVVGTGSELGPFYSHFLAAEPWTTRVETTTEPLGPLGAWMLYADRPAESRGVA